MPLSIEVFFFFGAQHNLTGFGNGIFWIDHQVQHNIFEIYAIDLIGKVFVQVKL